MPFLYDLCNVNVRLFSKGLIWSRGEGGGTLVKLCPIFYMLNSKKTLFPTYIFRLVQSTFADNSKVEPTIFFMKKVSLKLFFGHVMGRLPEVLYDW